jgi:uncharacterized protein YndB with AHSA1/START domain
MQELGSTEHGCLLLADITGYTDYIGQTEITHAQDVVADLIETIVDVITPTFAISRIEGDAAFAFAEAGTVSPAILMDLVDSTYFAFRRRVRDVAHATSCPCQACIRIPGLDLKFFLHEGEYAVRRVAGFKELSGIDVIVLFRLAKGTASSVVDDHGYAVYTRALVDVMGFEPSSIGLLPHHEEFADTGPIEVFVQDLEERWRAAADTTEVLVTPSDAAHQAWFETAAPPQLVWEYLTDPQKRLEWQTHVTELIPTGPGRQQTGSVNHCMHGPDVTIEQVADWRPFGHLTLRYDVAGVQDWLWTYRLDRLEAGTRLTLLLDDPGPDHWEQLRAEMSAHVNGMVAGFGQVVDQAWAKG